MVVVSYLVVNYKMINTEQDFELLRSVVEDQMYEKSEKSLFSFYKSFWTTHDPSDLHVSWVQECVCEHIQAALQRKIRRLILNIPPRCFDENMYVTQANGIKKQGKDIQIGDEVLSFNSDSGDIEPKKVFDVIDSGTKQCVQLTFSNNTTLTCSTEHKIWSGTGKYIQADALKTGDIVWTYTNKHIPTQIKVTDLKQIGERKCMDLTVEGNHNFYCNDILVSNSGKTTMALSGAVWNWIHVPHEKYWFLSHSARLYTPNILTCRRMMTHPRFKRWIPERFAFTKDQNTKNKIENNHNGYLLGGSPTSTALGIGYTVAMLDDILDSEQSNNPVAVENVNNFYTNTFLNRSNDVNNDVIIILMQRLAENDITDYVNRKYGEQGWFNLVLPARYDPHRIFFSPIGFNDKRTLPGELLDEARLPGHFLLQQEKNPIIYNTRYQQDPGANGAGNFVQREWIKKTPHLPPVFDYVVIVWDLSFNDKAQNSFTVGSVLGVYQGKKYLFDMFRGMHDVIGQLEGVKLLHEKLPKAGIYIEARANANAVVTLLKDTVPDINLLEPKLYGGSKEQRLASVLPVFHDPGLYLYDPSLVSDPLNMPYVPHESYNVDEIVQEIVTFPLGRNKDIVDTVAYGLAILSHEHMSNTAVITKGVPLKFDETDYVRQSIDDPYTIFEDGCIATRADIMEMWDV